MTRNASTLLVAALLALACGSSEPERPSAAEEQQALLFRSMTTLEAAPDRVREEVLKSCDKWKHIHHPCVDQDVRTDQLECWLEKGIPALELNLKRRIGPRTRDLNVMREQNLCMERRGWRKLKRGAEF
jgi:hypothetical protein